MMSLKPCKIVLNNTKILGYGYCQWEDQTDDKVEDWPSTLIHMPRLRKVKLLS